MRRPLAAGIIPWMSVYLRQFVVICALILAPVGAIAGQTVTVFAAASLREALDDVVRDYDGDVVVSYGGSGQIARQVAQGAPADIIILANTAWMDWLQERGLVQAERRFDLLQNTLVLAGPAGAEPLAEATAESLLARLDGARLAIGQTGSVPAGIYGRQWLENAGLWRDLAPHLAETENVRAALALIARGEVPLGIVYGSDVQVARDVVTLYEIPDDLHDVITYPAANVGINNSPEAHEFMLFLMSDKVKKPFVSLGFRPIEGSL